jgi:hypothetical protein
MSTSYAPWYNVDLSDYSIAMGYRALLHVARLKQSSFKLNEATYPKAMSTNESNVDMGDFLITIIALHGKKVPQVKIINFWMRLVLK